MLTELLQGDKFSFITYLQHSKKQLLAKASPAKTIVAVIKKTIEK